MVEYRIGWHEDWLSGRRMGVNRVMITRLKRPIFVRSWIIADTLCRVVFDYQSTVVGYRAGFKSKRE